ncbi:MAG: lipid-A-disaccharide synthase, partial [Limisphaerales bacterium]
MKSKSIMLIAGETSGDMLAAELVKALRAASPTSLEFFGAGGPKMAEAGVELAVDMTAHSVIGLFEVLKNYSRFKKIFDQLLQLALERKPDVIICVDFSGFNRRFARAVRNSIPSNSSGKNWNPKIVQYVSPQVWASRPSRAEKLARDIDLLLCIFPFEKNWYAKRIPTLRVEFVGHPMMDRYARFTNDDLRFTHQQANASLMGNRKSQILLLPGSRVGELQRHLPVMVDAARQISAKRETQFKII